MSNLWKGIISQHLALMPVDSEDQTSQTRKKKKKNDNIRTSNEWASRLIASTWHCVLILWDLRNWSIHGVEGSSFSSAEKSRLLDEAKLILESSSRYQEHFELEWFKEPIEELEKYSVISLKAWIRNARMMVKLHQLEIRKTTKTTIIDEGNLSDANSIASTGTLQGIAEDLMVWSIVKLPTISRASS